MPAIRPYRADDCAALYAICLQCSHGGGDGSALYRDGDLIGHIYAGPYAALAPETVLVVEDELGVGGYIVGPHDTRAFEDDCEANWWPELRARHPLPVSEEQGFLDAYRIRSFHAPYRTPLALCLSHPAHLHINLLPRLQRQGWGRRLIGTWRAAVAARGAPAAHLAVGEANPNAIAFYRHYGFELLITPHARADVYYFGIPC